MIAIDRTLGLVIGAAAVLGLVALSNVHVASGVADHGLLRLTWRARPERVEHCVTQSPEALAALPPHMRQTRICEGINASYRLDVWRDGTRLASQLVVPGGLRRDRPLYVFEELPIPAGQATIRVTFTRVEGGEDEEDDRDEAADARDALREAIPESLVWERSLTLAPRQVRIVSYDPQRRELIEVVAP